MLKSGHISNAQVEIYNSFIYIHIYMFIYIYIHIWIIKEEVKISGNLKIFHLHF